MLRSCAAAGHGVCQVDGGSGTSDQLEVEQVAIRDRGACNCTVWKTRSFLIITLQFGAHLHGCILLKHEVVVPSVVVDKAVETVLILGVVNALPNVSPFCREFSQFPNQEVRILIRRIAVFLQNGDEGRDQHVKHSLARLIFNHLEEKVNLTDFALLLSPLGQFLPGLR